MHPTRKSNRRAFLKATALATAGAAVAACSPPTPPIPTTAPKAAEPTKAAPPAATAAPTQAAATAPAATAKPATGAATAAPAAGKYKEAPALADLVKAGKLPAVEQRLPKEPMVITPNEKVGVYGGRWRSGLLGKADTSWLSRTIGNEGLVKWSSDLKSLQPNVAKKWEVSPDGKVFTFYLREGMRWSDGEPFTADDFVFWYEDIILNDELTKIKPIWMRPGGKLGKLEKVDASTIKFTFEQPNGLFLKQLASNVHFWRQAKYSKQFHIKYNKDAVEKAVKDGKLNDWMTYFTNMTDYWQTPACPTVLGWMITQGVTDTVQVVAKRNPYYWKVDTAGNQLPYIDEAQYPIVDKVDVLVLKALNGEIDMMDRHIATPENKAVFTDAKAKGGFDFFSVKYAWEGPCVIGLNLAHKDPGLKEVFNKKDFRVALSHAMNRKEIIDTIYVGDGEPNQAAPLPESALYNEKLAKQYTEYDPKKANELLDALGLKKGADGFRTRLDGKPLFFTIEVAQAFEPWANIMEMVTKYWKAVGVNCAVKAEDRSLFYQRKASYDIDGGVWTGADAVQVVMDPRWSMAYSNESVWAVAWADWWNSGGKQGVEPPEPAKKQQALYDQLRAEADEAKQQALMKQILDIAVEQFWCMSITKYYKGYGLVKNNFKNLPKEVWQWHLSNSPAQTMPEQYYFQQ